MESEESTAPPPAQITIFLAVSSAAFAAEISISIIS